MALSERDHILWQEVQESILDIAWQSTLATAEQLNRMEAAREAIMAPHAELLRTATNVEHLFRDAGVMTRKSRMVMAQHVSPKGSIQGYTLWQSLKAAILAVEGEA